MTEIIEENDLKSVGSKGLLYQLEPDYTKPLLEVPEELKRRILGRLAFLYGEERLEEIYREVERIMRVHYAYATPELIEMEKGFEPSQRFTQRDVVLITYGDLILSEHRTPLQTLADFAEVFFHGIITTLHILPFFPYSSDRGFSVISYDEVDPRLGTWDEIAELACSFKLMFDGVLNHISSKSEYFQRYLDGNPDFQDAFIAFSTSGEIDEERIKLILRPRTSSLLTEFPTINGSRFLWTTFSADQIDLNYKNSKVLFRILEFLLLYVRRGADMIRLDAVTYLWYEMGTSCAHLDQTHEVVKLFRDIFDVVAPHVALITETNVPHEDNITYFGNGSDEAQMVYNFALPPLLLHTFQTGNTEILTRWAKTLLPPTDTTAFFNFLDSHDGIGLMGARGILSEQQIDKMTEKVRAHGGFVSMRDSGDGTESPYELNITWYSALNLEDGDEPVELKVDRFVASRAVALALRGVPGIYLPSMFGSQNDIEAVYRDGSKRSINRGTIQEAQLFEAFGNPESIPARIAKRYVRLLETRVSEQAFHPNGEQQVLDIGPKVFALLRISPDHNSRVLSLINVSEKPVALNLTLDDAGLKGQVMKDLITEKLYPLEGDDRELTLDPYQVLWLKW
jgi:sucrose phosphorylase